MAFDWDLCLAAGDDLWACEFAIVLAARNCFASKLSRGTLLERIILISRPPTLAPLSEPTYLS